MEKGEALSVTGRIRFGSIKLLRNYIGDENFKYLAKNDFIYLGKSYPDVWRITDKGIRRYRAVNNKLGRIIAWILIKLGFYDHKNSSR